ncbi:hypothetical protein S7711_09323 [Stachybotrys chartarum IBT 7711]|uniref:N-acetyltransferase domain-containing protein n=1 Tax=Stachybotrys chartarum (strain CBS 109288 / IBT 7711) TaxID=1280523 RepID=A0A084ARR4_STACB|nr:hypothetical protein S7711_09323 [Stachybotrys chartarum IBT 7711]
MANLATELRQKSWTKGAHLISTDASLIPIPDLMRIFDSPDIYWATALPASAMRAMLDNSLSFGLYELAADPPRALLGFARCITDFTTFLYLTDVWVSPACRGTGLGSWLVRCVQEVAGQMPHLRRSMLVTGDWERSVPYYQRLMDMELVDSQPGKGMAVMTAKGRGHPSYGKDVVGEGWVLPET